MTISINFKHGKFRCSPNATNQPKSTVELGYMCKRWSCIVATQFVMTLQNAVITTIHRFIYTIDTSLIQITTKVNMRFFFLSVYFNYCNEDVSTMHTMSL